MPGFDGTGPQGEGPMTGRARGYCVLRESNGLSNHVQGFAGVQGTPVEVEFPEGKEVADMPFGDSPGPVGFWPMVGRPVAYPLRRYANSLPMGTVPPLGVYGPALYAYRWSWRGRGFRWAPFGWAYGRGRGRGCGRGRFGFPR